MECNKEEAVRAKEIAVKKMQNGDFVAAKKFVLKAKQLYPDIDNVAQLLTVCEVHCSASSKINGSDMDWYGILQIERFSDEAVIKKQYRKLALSLHPDKNKFAGAEAAFKLIGEANRVLTDPAKRNVYDLKCKFGTASQKSTSHQANRNLHVKKQYAGVNIPGAPYSHHQSSNPFPQPQQRPTFWTCCSSCGVRFQYYRDFLNKVLRCQSCSQNFLAHDLGVHGMPPGTSWSQYMNRQGVPNQGPSKVPPQSSSRKPAAGKVGSESTLKSGKPVGSGTCPESKESKGANNPDIGKGVKPQEKVNGHMGLGSGNAGSVMPKTDSKKQKQSGSTRACGRGKKRGRKSTEYSSESFDTCNSDDEEEDVTMENANGGHPSRKSSRIKQNVSFKENADDEHGDSVVPPFKKPRENGSVAVRSGIVCGLRREGFCGLSATASVANGNKRRFKQTSLEQIWSQKGNKADEFQVRREEEPVSVKPKVEVDSRDVKFEADNDCKSDVNEADNDGKLDVNDFQSPDPEFYNFDDDKLESSFEVNQVWALYDQKDCMPRYYARIKKVLLRSVFQLQIVWLEPSSNEKNEQQWHDADLPVGCGKFETGGTDTVDLSMISHHMLFTSARRGNYQIYPRKGETWAIFKDWDMKWLSEPEKHQSPYQFQYVEILSDFDSGNGVGVSYLGKVKGFVSTFQPNVAHEGVISFCIPPNELYRFSHRVPSHRLKGDERPGIPVGSFELDPAALPGDLFKSVDSAQDSHKPEISASFTPRKQQMVAADFLQPRRSPRDLSKGFGETKGSHPPAAAKKLDNHGQASATSSHSGVTKSTVRKVVVEPYDFKSERSEDKFATYHVWAMFSDKDGLPRSYARIEKIVKTPDVKLHVVFLESCLPPKDARLTPCWGTFIVKKGKTVVVPVTKFSHRLKVEHIKGEEYKIYPGEGEIWALYRTKPPETSSSNNPGEYDIVQVLGVDDSGARVVPMQRVDVTGRHFYRIRKTHKSKPNVTTIPMSEFVRFSHRCCASQHASQKDDRLKGFWEIDPKSLPEMVILD